MVWSTMKSSPGKKERKTPHNWTEKQASGFKGTVTYDTRLRTRAGEGKHTCCKIPRTLESLRQKPLAGAKHTPQSVNSARSETQCVREIGKKGFAL